MLRQIQVNGQSFELRSTDGSFWASSPKALIKAKHRQALLSSQCRANANDLKTCRALDMIHDPEPFGEIHSMSSHLPLWGRTPRK